MIKNSFVFGIISGMMISAFMGTTMAIIGCSAGEPGNGSMIIGFSAMIAAFSFIFIGIKKYRDNQNGGVVTFGVAFLLGLTISLIASTIYVLTWAVEFHYFFPDFMDKYSAVQIRHLRAGGITGTALDKAAKDIEADAYSYKHNAFVFAAYTYMEILPVGIIISLVSALILKRKAPKTVQQQRKVLMQE